MHNAVRPIADLATDLGFDTRTAVPYGASRAKISLAALDDPGPDRAAHVLVTAMTPTSAGEGKTVTAIGLAMGLVRIGRRAVVTLRQSSLGPLFGAKGGGAGGGRAGLVPIDECTLGLADDMFAVEMANNLLAAAVDDHAFRQRTPALDPAAISWRRVVDVDDRSLRHVTTRLDGKPDGAERVTGFSITPASEVMAVLALSRDRADLRRRLGDIVVGFTPDGAPVTAEHVRAAGSMAALLQRALLPNLVQTTEGTPAIVHTGAFANLAHGNSSVIADLIADTRCEFVVTEAGFASDLGAEKYVHLKLPVSQLPPSAAVLVATVRAVRGHDPAGVDLEPGFANLRAHVANLRRFAIPVVVALNRFPDDRDDDVAALHEQALAAGAAAVVDHHAYTAGGAGCVDLAEAVAAVAIAPAAVVPVVDRDAPIADKVEQIATTIYGAAGVEWSPEALSTLELLRGAGFDRLPVCIAKTNRSLSHDARLLGAPHGFTFPVRELRLAAGAGFVTVLAGPIMTMPGLPDEPHFASIDVDAQGNVVGLA